MSGEKRSRTKRLKLEESLDASTDKDEKREADTKELLDPNTDISRFKEIFDNMSVEDYLDFSYNSEQPMMRMIVENLDGNRLSAYELFLLRGEFTYDHINYDLDEDITVINYLEKRAGEILDEDVISHASQAITKLERISEFLDHLVGCNDEEVPLVRDIACYIKVLKKVFE